MACGKEGVIVLRIQKADLSAKLTCRNQDGARFRGSLSYEFVHLELTYQKITIICAIWLSPQTDMTAANCGDDLIGLQS